MTETYHVMYYSVDHWSYATPKKFNNINEARAFRDSFNLNPERPARSVTISSVYIDCLDLIDPPKEFENEAPWLSNTTTL